MWISAYTDHHIFNEIYKKFYEKENTNYFHAVCCHLNYCQISKCDALSDLLPFVQFKKREKHPFTKSNTPPWDGCFSRILNCTNCTKSRNFQNNQRLPHGLPLSVPLRGTQKKPDPRYQISEKTRPQISNKL